MGLKCRTVFKLLWRYIKYILNMKPAWFFSMYGHTVLTLWLDSPEKTSSVHDEPKTDADQEVWI